MAYPFTPLWLVWIIAAGVALVLVGLFLNERKPGRSFQDTTGVNLRAFLGISIFGSSIFLGPLITAFASPTRLDWWQALAARATLHLGGALLLVGSLALDNRTAAPFTKRNLRKLYAAFTLVAVAMSWSSMRDLIQGPVLLRGTATLAVEKSPGERGGASISALMHLTAPDGSTQDVDLSGWGANRAEHAFARCQPGSAVDMTVLRHIDAILDVVCR